MKVTIVPASTQAGKAVIESLLGRPNPPQIRAIYRDTAKAPANLIGHTYHESVQGGLDDGLNLDFGNSDAVFYIPPPTYDEEVHNRDHATHAANKVKEALRKASSVRRLVVLSALGAQHSHGIGTLQINHITDRILADSTGEVVIARPGWFQENWAEALDTAKADQPFFEAYFSPEDHKIAMVSLRDVGEVLADQVLETGQPLPSQPDILLLHGPRNYSMVDLQDALEKVTGKKPRRDEVRPTELVEFYERKVPPGKARELAEMTVAINGGGLLAGEMASPQGHVVRGKTELVDTLRRIAAGDVIKAASGAF